MTPGLRSATLRGGLFSSYTFSFHRGRISTMVEIKQHPTFTRWLSGLRDKTAKGAIARRLLRVSVGNFGDAKPVGDGVSELRIDVGPGYRVYYGREGARLVVLLAGGDKSTQRRDIAAAVALWQELKGNES